MFVWRWKISFILNWFKTDLQILLLKYIDQYFAIMWVLINIITIWHIAWFWFKTKKEIKVYLYLSKLFNISMSNITNFYLTPNRSLIQLWCAQSKLNMDEICSLNIHLWYVDTPQKVLLKSLHAQKRPFLLLNL